MPAPALRLVPWSPPPARPPERPLARARPREPTALDWVLVAPLAALGGVLAVGWLVWALTVEAGRGGWR